GAVGEHVDGDVAAQHILFLMQVAAATGRTGDSLQAGDVGRHAPKFGAIGAIGATAQGRVRRRQPAISKASYPS
ncbi:MAG: hypothetical protein AB1745_03405, partial [Pseudomonadota bacterium]